jgi:hypothetical protein
MNLKVAFLYQGHVMPPQRLLRRILLTAACCAVVLSSNFARAEVKVTESA